MKNKPRETSSQKAPPPIILRLLPWLCPPLSGLLLVAGFPYYNVATLPWVALVPLLFALRGRGVAARLLMGYMFGMAFLGALLYWITFVRYPASLGYAGFLLIFPVIFAPWAALAGWALDAPCSTKHRGLAAIALLLPAAGWVAVELAMSYGTFAFPVWSLAVTQAGNLPVAQIAEFTGMYGISFLVVMANVFFLRAALRGLREHRKFWIAAAVVFAAVVIFGAATLQFRSFKSCCGLKVALIQTNISQDEKEDAIKRGISLEDMYRIHWEMTAEAMRKHKPEIVVWPESVLPIELLTNDYYLPMTEATLDALDVTLVAGVYEGLHNSVVSIDPQAGVEGKYDKMHLVPFGEFVPYRKALGFTPALKKWIDDKVYEIDVEPGREYEVFNTGRGRFSAIICFESVFPYISRRMARDGAEFIFVVTNDAWFQRSPAAAHHIAMAQLRAIENRRPVAQAAATGISAIIDASGRITAQSEIMKKTIVAGEIFPNSKETFYTRYGDVFGVLCIGFLLFGIVLLIRYNYK